MSDIATQSVLTASELDMEQGPMRGSRCRNEKILLVRADRLVLDQTIRYRARAMNILHLALVFSTRRHKLLTFNENQPRGSGRRDQEVKVKQPELQKVGAPYVG